MFRVGDRVKHEKRGTGVVTLIDEDTGKTRIRFDGEQMGDHGYDRTSLASGKIELFTQTLAAFPQGAGGSVEVSELAHDEEDEGTPEERLLRFLRSVSVLADLDEEQLLSVMAASEIETRNSGSVIFREDDTGDVFYMIRRGSVSVTNNEKGLLGELSAGECFGEKALEMGDVRNATIECLEDCEFVCLERNDYQEIVGSMTLVRYLANPTRACVLRKVEEMLEADPECARATIERDGREDHPLHQHLVSDFVNDRIVTCLLEAYPKAAETEGILFSLPLHLYLKVCADKLRSTSLNIVRSLVKAYPKAAKIQFNNAYPLGLHLYKNAKAEFDVVRLLYEAYPESLQYNGAHGTPLASYLCDNRFNAKVQPRIVKYLLDMFPEAARDRIGAGLPLHWQCLNEFAEEEVIQALLRAYPDSISQCADPGSEPSPDGRHVVGDLPLHCYLYCMHANPSIVQILVNAYPSGPSIPNANGDLPLHLYLRANKHSNEVRASLRARSFRFIALCIILTIPLATV
jgi:hypothetical protein